MTSTGPPTSNRRAPGSLAFLEAEGFQGFFTVGQLHAERCEGLPNEPGVYRMLDERGEPLYVGKAKSLRKRVPAYAKSQGLSARLQRMVALTRSMEFVTTASEDLSDRVARTWWVCAYRLAAKLATERSYLRHLLDPRAGDRVFALTLLRLLTAYRIGSMRYGLFVFDRPP